MYYVESTFYSACNARILPEEALWQSNSMKFRPEIVELARHFIENRKDLDLKLGQIKSRYSHTVEDSYTSFGCFKCDSIFGDWYVMDAEMDMLYAPKELTHQGEIHLKQIIEIPIRHWCFPDNRQFCEQLHRKE